MESRRTPTAAGTEIAERDFPNACFRVATITGDEHHRSNREDARRVAGKQRIEGTRVGVFQLGETVRTRDWSVEEGPERFGLDVEEVRAALEYYDDHPELMDALRTQRQAREQSIEDGTRAE